MTSPPWRDPKSATPSPQTASQSCEAKKNEEYSKKNKEYSKNITEATLLGLVSALERYQDRLSIFAAWLDLHELASAEDHQEDTEEKKERFQQIPKDILQGIKSNMP